jgi:excisionase family DNA binding protein
LAIVQGMAARSNEAILGRPAAPASGHGGVGPLEEILTCEQVAALLQLRRSTVEDYARRGVLPSLKLGRHRRFVRSQVERAIVSLLEWG